MRARTIVAALALLAVPAILFPQTRPLVGPEARIVYQRLLPQIARIRIFDHHAHPGVAGDAEVDPGTGAEWALPMRLRPDDPDWAAADRALFGTAGKAAMRQRNPGARYFSAVLDRLGIETSVANRITMPDYLEPARFKWVFYADPLLFPFDNAGQAAKNPDMAAFMPNETRLEQRFLQQAGLSALPASLADYAAFVTGVLEDHKRRGAIAAKFEVSYFRSFVFDDPPRDAVVPVYDKYRSGGVPTAAEYKQFQDFIFRHIVSEAGRLGLPVHIHSSAGAGNYYSLAGANVLNLETILHDPRYASTKFVLIHGGWPFDVQAGFLSLAPNVWVDSSGTGTFILYPDELKRLLRRWFEISPEKVTYGSDAFPIDEHIGAEQLYWFGVHSARTAAAAALAEMVAAGEISEARAMTIARGYLHDNAAQLYR